jgi:SAM-dependent methyltransferase
MIHHLPGDDLKRRAFAEIRRVLAPGGRLLVVDFEPPADCLLKHLMSHILGHGMMDHDARRLPVIMEASGFTEVHAGRTSHRLLSFVCGRAGKEQNGRP